MSLFYLLKVVHIVGATVLLGSGAAIAFFMLMAHRTRDARLIAHTASVVVIADFLFTASAVALQPLTGAGLARELGLPLTTPWLAASLGLYLVTGAFWIPVVGMQKRMRDLARQAARDQTPLPQVYFKLWRLWFAFGFPAFFAVIAIIVLMTVKPSL